MQKTAYEMRISVWSSDVCSTELCRRDPEQNRSNPEGTPKWLRSWACAALRVAMLPAAATQTQYLRHFDASIAQLMVPDPRLTSSIPSFDHDELIQSHPVPTLLIDGGGVVLFVNAAAEQLCNVSRSTMVGRVIYDVIAMDRGYRQRMSDATTSALLKRQEHTSELQSLMRISYAVFCLKKKKKK